VRTAEAWEGSAVVLIRRKPLPDILFLCRVSCNLWMASLLQDFSDAAACVAKLTGVLEHHLKPGFR
jgi:hypothetical protein